MNRGVAIGLALVVAMLAAVAEAQEPPQLPGPEKEHQWLKKFVGEWTTCSKADMGPGQPPMECTGSLNSRMLGEDGKWITFMSGTAKRKK